MKSLYIQLFHEGCPETAPLIGTAEYPVYHVGWYHVNESGGLTFDFSYPPMLSMFEGRMVNIWAEDFENKIIRNVLFSKHSILKLGEGGV